MARSQKSKTKHNSTVKDLAKKLENQGYQVKADVPGFSQPETIGGYRPDVVAKKGKQKKIIEVETQDSVNTSRDVKQQNAFQRAAKRRKNTTFKRVVTDK